MDTRSLLVYRLMSFVAMGVILLFSETDDQRANDFGFLLLMNLMVIVLVIGRMENRLILLRKSSGHTVKPTHPVTLGILRQVKAIEVSTLITIMVTVLYGASVFFSDQDYTAYVMVYLGIKFCLSLLSTQSKLVK